MAKYAIAFDLKPADMRADGLSAADVTRVYQMEVPRALAACGFTAHPQGSLYHTEDDQEPITAIMRLQSCLREMAPNFCRCARRIHVFRLDEWSDVTALIADHPADGPPEAAEEIAELEAEHAEGA